MKTTLATMTMCLMLCAGAVSRAESPTGSLVGRIIFTGPSAPDQVIEITRDLSVCGKTATIQTVAVNQATRGLAAAVVSFNATSDLSTNSRLPPLVLANTGCTFSPHTVVGEVGQQLELRNEDPIMHNTHITMGTRTFMNVALVPAGRPVAKHLKQAGIYEVRCDAHKFMTATVMAFPHPFFSVTDETGTFRIPQLPSGEHVMTIWHKTLGTYQKRITIPAHGEANVTIEYPADAKSREK